MARLLVGLIILFITTALPAAAAKRVALVIGNANYKFVPTLDAPPRDVRLLVETLRKVGFDDVILQENLDGQGMRNALREFSDLAGTADVAMIYFSGHGVELSRRNFMVPVDAKLKRAKDADFEAVELEHFRTAVDGASKLRMVVLDACRNNPFPLETKDGSRAARSRGLAEVQPGVNELIAFSAQAGVVADDRAPNGYSPFATSFAKWIAEPGMDIRFVMGNVRDDVLNSTGTTDEREGPQIPYVESSLGGAQIVFNAAKAAPPLPQPPPVADRNAEAKLAFDAASSDINMLKTVASDFADTIWGKLAAGRVKSLETSQKLALATDTSKNADDAERKCDILTATDDDPARSIKRVAFDKIVATSAIPACRQAVKAAPNNLRLLLQLGRALDVAKEFEEARKFYLEAVGLGSARAMFRIGLLYDNGEGVKEDNAEAASWYLKAAEAGNADGMNNLAFLYQNAEGVGKNLQEARRWYTKSAELGNVDAMNNLGWLHDDTGIAAFPDLKEALRWYTKSSEAGNSLAMVNLGRMYDDGRGVKKDDAKAVYWYRKAADLGNPHGLNNFAIMLRDGEGIAKDLPRSAELLKKSASAGNVVAMRNLGFSYKNGTGIKIDLAEAANWFRKASDSGDHDAMIELGLLYDNGEGVPKDDTEAVRLYRKAADGGNAIAISNLGTMYESGEGVTADLKEAARLYRKAAEAGGVQGMKNLAAMLRAGKGVPKNIAEAKKWETKAKQAEAN